jgi:hypothetical protein
MALPLAVNAQKKDLEPRLQGTLDSLYTAEQLVYKQWAAARGDSARTLAERARLALLERHQRKAQALTAQYGLPTYALVGQATSRRFNEMVLHYDRVPGFQQQVQQLMAQQIRKNNVDDAAFATLTDVVELGAGRPQVYGTQLSYQDNQKKLLVAGSLLEPLQVNVRRAVLGLEPLEAYLQKQNSKKHQPKTKHNPKKG